MEALIYCNKCNARLNNELENCEKCGHNEKTIRLDFNENINVREQIKGKLKDITKTGKRKEPLKFIIGDETSANGEWVFKERIVDYPNDRYYEKVVKDNGEVIRNVNESLKKHIGRGSAKFK
ncbi:MAG: hypothetical protein SFY32_14090 [Bacteroidota bacterium]|nr:hypothetical protein [Bacteroidota bacterium]